MPCRWRLWHDPRRGTWSAPPPGAVADGRNRSRRARPGRPATGRIRSGSPSRLRALARREETALAPRTRDRYTAVQALRGQGKGIKTIMRELGPAKEAVRR